MSQKIETEKNKKQESEFVKMYDDSAKKGEDDAKELLAKKGIHEKDEKKHKDDKKEQQEADEPDEEEESADESDDHEQKDQGEAEEESHEASS